VIGLTETWTDDNAHNEQLYHLQDYKAVFKSRAHSIGGGVALLVNKEYEFKIRADFPDANHSTFESRFIEIIVNEGENIVIGVIYRPPGTNLNSFQREFDEILFKIDAVGKKCFILVDFNINLMNAGDHHPTDNFINSLISSSFMPLTTKPTRITEHSATLIDNIFSNDLAIDRSLKSGIFITDITDHFPIFVLLKLKLNKPRCRPCVMKRIINDHNINRCRRLLLGEEWLNVYSCVETNSAYGEFERSFIEHYCNSFPVRQTTAKNTKSKPWLTTGLLNCIKIKNKLYKFYIQNRTENNKVIYTRYKNRLGKVLNKAERNYYSAQIQQSNNDMKKIWSIISELLNRKSHDSLPPVFRNGDLNVNGEENIARGFNTFFSNVGANLARQIPPSNKHYTEYMGPQNHTNFFLYPTDKNEIEIIVNGFNSNKSPGHDEISSRVLKSIIDLISEPLSYVFNLSLSNGTVPDSLKIARITPIYKSGDNDQFTNYRPVSVLSCISKILEKLVHKRLYSFINKNKLLNANQFGFRENHSTAYALTKIVDIISQKLDLGDTVIGTFLDLSKAFDTIDHDILIGKLNHYGIRGVSSLWFKNYLTNRKQSVKIGNTVSEMENITCGVPQGSILGPLLFILYINDCSNYLNNSELFMFADDTNLFSSGRNIANLEESINAELNILSEWFKTNRLSLNIKKTHFMIFNKKRSIRNVNILVNGTPIEQVQFTDFLGITFDDHLNWKEHARRITKKLARKIGIINHLKKSLPVRILPSLYSAFVLPQLQYCNMVWGRNFQVNIDPIIILQKKIIRIISKADYLATTGPLFKSLKFLKFHDINRLQLGEFMYKFQHSKLPVSFDNYFRYLTEIHNHNTRGRRNLNVEFCHTVSKTFSVKIAGPKLWNNLPVKLRNSLSLSIFKSNYKQNLLSTY